MVAPRNPQIQLCLKLERPFIFFHVMNLPGILYFSQLELEFCHMQPKEFQLL